MPKSILPLAAATLAFAALSPSTNAATQLGPYLSFGGFGTLGGVRTDSDEGQYGRDRQVGGANKSLATDVDSNLGLQLTATATPWLSGTVQVLSAKRDQNLFETKFEWAYLQVKPLDGLSIRGGRMTTPVFAISDSRNIGYANTWVRAPNEVYALNVFRTFDGADITYRVPFGSQSVSVTGLAGKTSFHTLGFHAYGDDLRGLNLQWETDWATLRIGRVRTVVGIPALGFSGDGYTFTGAGVLVDRDNIVAQAEYVQRRSTQQAGTVNADGWYAMGGYHFGNVLPYAIYSSTRPKIPGIGNISGTQKTTALGVRWDAFSSAALKLQVDHVDTDNTTGISFTTPVVFIPQPGPPPHAPLTRSVNVVSLVLDFTF